MDKLPGSLDNLTLEHLTSNDPAMERCLALAAEVAKSDLPILLLGESGTGKTLLAHAIHNSSHRKPGPFVSFNASAMSDTLLESQLFGHEKGSFTGATALHRGWFEVANNGTLFFDEIADMSPLAQAKVLRAVEYGEFERLGSEATLQSDVRIISATNKSLRRLSREGNFREDLYHRLNGITLLVPPLRKREADLPGLIASEFQTVAAAYGKDITGIDPDAYQRLLAYSWPGNLRELHRVIQTAVIFAKDAVIQPGDVVFDEDEFDEELAEIPTMDHAIGLTGKGIEESADGDLTLETATLRHISRVLELCGNNKRKTARVLGISRGRLDRHLEKLGD